MRLQLAVALISMVIARMFQGQMMSGLSLQNPGQHLIGYDLNGTTPTASFEKELENRKNNVFVSCTHSVATGFLCLERSHGPENTMDYPLLRVLNLLRYDNDFNLLEANLGYVNGEDPRVLNESIAFDNHQGEMQLINISDASTYPVYVDGQTASGKNYAWFEWNAELYAITWMKPLMIVKCNLGAILSCETVVDRTLPSDEQETDHSYRGGTVGYPSSDGVFGFGHITTYTDSLQHRVFLWKLRFPGDPTATVSDVELELDNFEVPSQLAICDPTSVVSSGSEVFLITAESTGPWGNGTGSWGAEVMEYHNKVYKLSGIRPEVR